jgi:hypothetical protein
MALSFWMAVVTGLLIAIPILSRPDREFIWGGLGTVVTWIQTGIQVIQRGKTPGPTYRTEKVCTDMPYGPPYCRDATVYVPPEPSDYNPIGDFFASFGQIFVEGLANNVGMLFAAFVEIFIVLLFLRKEAARKKRKEIVHPHQQSA